MTDLLADEIEHRQPHTARRAWRAHWRLAALAMAMVMLIGAAIVCRAVAVDRNEARGALEREQVLVVRSRAEAHDARAEWAAVRETAGRLRVELAAPFATVESLVQLSEQGVAASRDALAVANEATAAGVEAYNEAVTRANVVAEQYDATLRRLDEQLNALVGADIPTV